VRGMETAVWKDTVAWLIMSTHVLDDFLFP